MGIETSESLATRTGFFWGMRVFSKALARVWIVPELRTWFFKTLSITILLAFGIIVGLFALGSWGFSSYFESGWSAAAAAVLWAIALFYVGGQLAALLVSALVLLIGGESALSRYYFPERGAHLSLVRKEQLRLILKDRTSEVVSVLVSLLVACFAWPLLLLPVTMPIGVLIYAWAMAGDSLAVSRRVCHEGGYPAYQDSHKFSASTRMGLALMPASLALFPVLGWALLPVLQVAGLEAQKEVLIPLTGPRGAVPSESQKPLPVPSEPNNS